MTSLHPPSFQRNDFSTCIHNDQLPEVYVRFVGCCMIISLSTKVHNNTSGLLQVAILRPNPIGMMSVLVMLVSLLPSHRLWEETISVNQESTQVPVVVFIWMILSGMVKAAVAAVTVAHSTILHTSLSNSPAPPLTL